MYKVSGPYAREEGGGLHWNDSAFGIDLPIDEAEAPLNARDRSWPTLSIL